MILNAVAFVKHVVL